MPKITFSPCSKAIPVVFDPGSNLSEIDSMLVVTAFLRIMVYGNLLKTAALPATNNLRAIDGLQGVSSFLFVSSTKIKLDIVVSLHLRVMLASPML